MVKLLNTLRKASAVGLCLSLGLPPAALARGDEPEGPSAGDSAAPVTLVGVVGLYEGVPAVTSDRVGALLIQELRRQAGLAWVAPTDVAPPTEVDPRPATASPFRGAGARALAKAQALLVKARKDSARLRFAPAAAKLKEAIAGLEGSADLLEDFGQLTDAYVALAIAELRLGHKEAGVQALATVVRLDPHKTLSGDFPAVFVRLYAELQRRLLAGSRGTLSIASRLTGQSVRLDGRDVGPSPALVDVIPGRHFLRVGTGGSALHFVARVTAGGVSLVGDGDSPAKRGSGHGPGAAVEATAGSGPDPLRRILTAVSKNLIEGDGVRAMASVAQACGAHFVLVGGLHFIDDQHTVLALDTLAYSSSAGEVAALNRVQLDAELTTAPAELAKVAAEVAQKVSRWSDVVGIPSPIASDAAADAAPDAHAARLPSTKLGANEGRRDEASDLPPPVRRRPDGPETSSGLAAGDLGPAAEASEAGAARKASGGFPWAPVLIGVGLAAAVTAGVIVAVTVANEKAGSPTTVTW